MKLEPLNQTLKKLGEDLESFKKKVHEELKAMGLKVSTVKQMEACVEALRLSEAAARAEAQAETVRAASALGLEAETGALRQRRASRVSSASRGGLVEPPPSPPPGPC